MSTTQTTPESAIRMRPGTFGKQSSKIECPVCKDEVDYLLGENTPDGGVMGCEKCWKQPETPVHTQPPEWEPNQ